ncbi:MAG: ADP-ribosylglycohydrolase family protein [Nanoarchaeota archaeon]|nr:ADP-ribosylglycohydrolase family protein [Nanoarchaeota archaeon]
MSFNKCQNMLLGIAIGDAFGAGYEMQPRYGFTLYMDKYLGRNSIKPGCYTDDTQMSIAVAEVLASGSERSMWSFADSFVKCYSRDKRTGYTSGFTSVLNKCKNGQDLMFKVGGNSEKNGAAMRSVPFGILPKLEDALGAAIQSAIVTHNTKKGLMSAMCIAAASHYFYYNKGEPKDLIGYCIKACMGYDSETDAYLKEVDKMQGIDSNTLLKGNTGVPCDAMITTGAVLYIASRFNELKQVMMESVLLGGDTDTTASIAMGLSAIRPGLDTLSLFMLNDLENGAYGRDYLIQLGEKLFKKYPSQ